ncbi:MULTISPECIES: class F sortase [unclassified Nocardioides]|uniref:class F sortase n=1 Tax=unclassified Nocardioides TaxID=2615069 RepID=UPI0007039956|nr:MULTISPECIES: class F sortase [unclassified Nocardioides]KRA32598.1 hypothetical protein ASD81_13745 [Nocardioides sp. Root614]KRA89251.1 hypothetical protein ASD84_14010 [Nocardioides sp. Root682]
MTRRRTTATVAAAVAVALVACLVAWWLLRDDPEPEQAVEPIVTVTPATPVPVPKPMCDRSAREGFVPTAISVEGVVRRAPVLAVPRTSRDVPGVPPVSEKHVFAWDLGGVEPASAMGNVLLNTHTWPDGSAMGNALLGALDVGDQIVLRGDGKFACYRVAERIEVRDVDGFPGYKSTDGPPQIVIIVCSGQRTGPGQWTHRTLWFASPIGAESNPTPVS